MRYFEVVKDKFRKNPNVEIKLPTRSDNGAAGYDFYSPVKLILMPGDNKLFFTDVKACMNEDEVLMLYVRSSMGKHPIVISNGTGIIDYTYYNNISNDGNIGFRLLNLGTEPYEINIGDRIGQGVFTKFLTVDNDNTDGIRTGGFGSSGK